MRPLAALAAMLCLILAGCGVLPGTGDEGTQVVLAEPTLPAASPTPIQFDADEPTPEPSSAGPTPTESPTATAPPAPTPTPTVDDSYTTFLASLRSIFTSADKEAAIGALVPIPVDLFIPDDAELEQVELQYGQWDRWSDITGRFAPVDTAAQVIISISMTTATPVDDVAEAYTVAFSGAGFVVADDNGSPGQFSDVSYELNGGQFTRGRDGSGRVTVNRSGDANFVAVEMAVELSQDSRPALIEWPGTEAFPVPFSGGFYLFTATAIPGAEGVSVASTADWIIRGQLPDMGALLETLSAEYPTATVELSDQIAAPASGETATTTFLHTTGSAGTVQAEVTTDGTIIQITATSLPG